MPKMDEQEVREVIEDQILCRIAFHGAEYPYVVPFQYTFMDDSIYFHFTDYGKKMRLLGRDNRVCVEIEEYTPDLSEYKFVVMRGRLKVVEDSKERERAIRRMAQEGRSRLSRNFLAAHGFYTDEDWLSFSYEKPLVIVKLADVAQVMGLKNP